MPSVRFARDTAAGLFLAAIGLVFFLASDALPMGTASRMATALASISSVGEGAIAAHLVETDFMAFSSQVGLICKI